MQVLRTLLHLVFSIFSKRFPSQDQNDDLGVQFIDFAYVKGFDDIKCSFCTILILYPGESDST